MMILFVIPIVLYYILLYLLYALLLIFAALLFPFIHIYLGLKAATAILCGIFDGYRLRPDAANETNEDLEINRREPRYSSTDRATEAASFPMNPVPHRPTNGPLHKNDFNPGFHPQEPQRTYAPPQTRVDVSTDERQRSARHEWLSSMSSRLSSHQHNPDYSHTRSEPNVGLSSSSTVSPSTTRPHTEPFVPRPAPALRNETAIITRESQALETALENLRRETARLAESLRHLQQSDGQAATATEDGAGDSLPPPPPYREIA